MHKKRLDFGVGQGKGIVKFYKKYKNTQKLLISFGDYAII